MKSAWKQGRPFPSNIGKGSISFLSRTLVGFSFPLRGGLGGDQDPPCKVRFASSCFSRGWLRRDGLGDGQTNTGCGAGNGIMIFNHQNHSLEFFNFIYTLL